MGAIGTFLVLTFAITWTLWAVVLRAASASPEPSCISPLVTLGGPVLVIGVFAPALVAVALTVVDEGQAADGSLPLSMFMHSAFNNMKDILPSGSAPAVTPFTLDAMLVFRLTVRLLSIVAALLLVRMRGVWRVEGTRVSRPTLTSRSPSGPATR